MSDNYDRLCKDLEVRICHRAGWSKGHTRLCYRNPDGPAAAAAIKSLTAQLDRAREEAFEEAATWLRCRVDVVGIHNASGVADAMLAELTDKHDPVRALSGNQGRGGE